LRIEHRVGQAVASQEGLQAQRLRRVARAEQHQSRTAFDEENAPQNEGTHDGFADLRGRHYEGTDLRGIEWHRFRAVVTGATFGERCPARELADFAGQLPGSVRRDFVPAPEGVAARDLDGAGEHEVCGRADFSDLEHDLMGFELPRLTAEATRDGDLRRIQHGKHLLAAVFAEGGRRRACHADTSTSDCGCPCCAVG
jgi:hypothetical protein